MSLRSSLLQIKRDLYFRNKIEVMCLVGFNSFGVAAICCHSALEKEKGIREKYFQHNFHVQYTHVFTKPSQIALFYISWIIYTTSVLAKSSTSFRAVIQQQQKLQCNKSAISWGCGGQKFKAMRPEGAFILMLREEPLHIEC